MSEWYKHSEDNVMASLNLSEEDLKRYEKLSQELESLPVSEITQILSDSSDKALTILKLFESLNIVSSMLEKSAQTNLQKFIEYPEPLTALRESISAVTSVAMILYKSGSHESKLVFALILTSLLGMLGIFPISTTIEMLENSVTTEKISLFDVLKATQFAQALMVAEVPKEEHPNSDPSAVN